MKTHIFGPAAALGILLAVASPTLAQQSQNCGPRAMVLQRLSEGFGETRQSIGLGANNAVIEVFASQDTGTWTITVTLPNGMTCLVASGESFEVLAEALPARGNDT